MSCVVGAEDNRRNNLPKARQDGRNKIDAAMEDEWHRPRHAAHGFAIHIAVCRSAMKKVVVSAVWDLMAVAALWCLCFGLWRAWHPLGMIVVARGFGAQHSLSVYRAAGTGELIEPDFQPDNAASSTSALMWAVEPAAMGRLLYEPVGMGSSSAIAAMLRRRDCGAPLRLRSQCRQSPLDEPMPPAQTSSRPWRRRTATSARKLKMPRVRLESGSISSPAADRDNRQRMLRPKPARHRQSSHGCQARQRPNTNTTAPATAIRSHTALDDNFLHSTPTNGDV